MPIGLSPPRAPTIRSCLSLPPFLSREVVPTEPPPPDCPCFTALCRTHTGERGGRDGGRQGKKGVKEGPKAVKGWKGGVRAKGTKVNACTNGWHGVACLVASWVTLGGCRVGVACWVTHEVAHGVACGTTHGKCRGPQ